MGLSTLNTQAALDVLAERQRQMDAEGFDHERDDGYHKGEMVSAALAYGTRAAVWLRLRAGGASEDYIARAAAAAKIPPTWPWSSGWWKPHGLRRSLVIAAALIIAEIERLDREAARHGE